MALWDDRRLFDEWGWSGIEEAPRFFFARDEVDDDEFDCWVEEPEGIKLLI